MQLKDKNSEDRIDNLSAKGSTCTEHSRVAQLLAELLSVFLSLRWRTIGNGLVGDCHRRNTVIVRVAWAWWRKGLSLLARVAAVTASFLVAIGILSEGWGRVWFDLNVVDREDTLLASSQVLAQPPIGVHVFEDRDIVTNFESAVLWLIIAV